MRGIKLRLPASEKSNEQNRTGIGLFVTALVLSGLTAIPFTREPDLLAQLVGIPEAGYPTSANRGLRKEQGGNNAALFDAGSL